MHTILLAIVSARFSKDLSFYPVIQVYGNIGYLYIYIDKHYLFTITNENILSLEEIPITYAYFSIKSVGVIYVYIE